MTMSPEHIINLEEIFLSDRGMLVCSGEGDRA